MSSIYEWALKADDNGNSDNIINWQEGQPPSSVNDSARAMMKRIAEYLGDLSGTAAVQGDGNKLSINASSPISKYHDGLRLYFKQNATNTKNLEIQVGNLGFKPVLQSGNMQLIATPAGACQQGCIYEIIYSSLLQKGSGGWFLTNPTRLSMPTKLPTGSIAGFAAINMSDKDWLLCDGSQVRKVEYAELFKVLGQTWGEAAKGPDFFKIPDFRGVFLRGFDAGRALDKDRKFATLQEDDNKSHSHEASCEEAGEHSHKVITKGSGEKYAPIATEATSGPSDYYTPDIAALEVAGKHKHKASCLPSGGSEARPKNYALHYMIKT